MKRTYFIGLILGLIILAAVMAPLFSAEKRAGTEKFKAMNDDIMICNLLTGLFLSEEQVAQISPLAQKAGKLRADFEAQKESSAKKNTALLAAIKQEVMKTGDASEKSKQKHHQAKEEFERVEAAFTKSMVALNSQVQAILTDNQKMIVSEYKPCIVPIKSIANPERIGSAGGDDRIIKVLTRARQVPAERYPTMKERFLSHITEKLQKRLPEDKVASHLEEISRVMDEARAMDDQEFELKKSELAERVKPPEQDDNPEKALTKKIDRFLLNERFPAVAGEKLKIERQAANGGKDKSSPGGKKAAAPKT